MDKLIETLKSNNEFLDQLAGFPDTPKEVIEFIFLRIELNNITLKEAEKEAVS